MYNWCSTSVSTITSAEINQPSNNLFIMNTTAALPTTPTDTPDLLNEESRFWMKAVTSWKNVINGLLEKSTEIKASPEVTAEVAKTAGDLSLLAERLDPLYQELEAHNHELIVLCEQHLKDEAAYAEKHKTLYSRMRKESEEFRNLVRDMFKLEQSAYKRFLTR